MGMTFSTIQIQNRNQIAPEQFIQNLSTLMEAKGLVPTTEDESEFWYSFIFSKSKRWIAVNCSEYEVVDTTEDMWKYVRELAKSMKTTCILINVTDSDMVILNCFGETGIVEDNVIKGTSAFFGEPMDDFAAQMDDPQRASMLGLNGDSNGRPDFWKPLLVSNYTWEQWQEIWGVVFFWWFFREN